MSIRLSNQESAAPTVELIAWQGSKPFISLRALQISYAYCEMSCLLYETRGAIAAEAEYCGFSVRKCFSMNYAVQNYAGASLFVFRKKLTDTFVSGRTKNGIRWSTDNFRLCNLSDKGWLLQKLVSHNHGGEAALSSLNATSASGYGLPALLFTFVPSVFVLSL